MIDKCDICEYDAIGFIDFHDVCVQQCSTCGVIRATAEQYDRLAYNFAYEMNIGGMKHAMRVEDVTKSGAKEIERFTDFCSLKSFIPFNGLQFRCNSCKGTANEFMNAYFSDFTLIYCPFCNALYFGKDDFDKFLKSAEEHCHGFSVARMIKEIFHRGMKDNVKEQTI